MNDRNYLSEAESALRKKREAAVRLSEDRSDEVRKKIPDICRLDALLSNTGADILTAIMSGGDVDAKVREIREKNKQYQQERGKLLEANGYPADYTKIVYDCEKCADSGYVGINMCTCLKSAIAEMRLADSELGRLSVLQNFDNFDLRYYTAGKEREYMGRVCDILRRFSNEFSKDTYENWLLLGNTGLGKTHLSTAIGVNLIKKGFDVEYKTIQATLDDYETYQFKGGSSSEIRAYTECDLLIIDDLGTELSNQFTVAVIYNIINARINKRKSTIISTNLNENELRERYADRITSRLFGEYKPIIFKGKDIRQQKLVREVKK